jgi:indolepyruvate ferredoxin oxidoreductase
VGKKAETLDEVIARRVEFLTAYQDAAYAARYRDVVARVRTVSEPLALAVARNLFKLMACKDEYEVARLYSDGSFAEKLSKQFTGDFTLKFHLAPPIRGRVDGFTGKPVKSEYGPWMMAGFRLLAKMKRLRGTRLDVFGRTAERRMERQLITDYHALLETLLASPSLARSELALELACLPDMIRGFGHVKEANVARARQRQAELLASLTTDAGSRKAAE